METGRKKTKVIVSVPALAEVVFMKPATYTANYNNRNHIYVSGSDNCIEENLVPNSTNGIKVSGTGNIIVKNKARANTTNSSAVNTRWKL